MDRTKVSLAIILLLSNLNRLISNNPKIPWRLLSNPLAFNLYGKLTLHTIRFAGIHNVRK